MNINNTPPPNSQRIFKVADLPPHRELIPYSVTNDGEAPFVARLANRNRQVMDLLMQGPVYCASPVRISDIVHILKREIKLDVETKMFRGDPTTGAGDYGVYFLRSRVLRLEEVGQAA